MTVNSNHGEATATRHWWDRPWKTTLFVLVVIIPTLMVAVYYSFFAANQYVTEFRFDLRSASTPSLQTGTGSGGGAMVMGGAGGGLNPAVVWDSYVIVEFIQSRALVDDLRQKIDFNGIYTNSQADFLTRLNPRAPIEKITAYWKNIADPFFNINTGIISVKVRAFTPQDSLLVAQTVLTQSEELINRMTKRARKDALQFFIQDVKHAQEQLDETSDAIQAIQTKYGLLTPRKTASLTANMRSVQEENLASLKAQYQSTLNSVGRGSPLLPIMRNQIAAAEQELDRERYKETGFKLTAKKGEDADAMSHILMQYEGLLREQKLREGFLVSAEASLQGARINLDRQQLYLDPFEPPAMAGMSTYPRRVRSVSIVFGFAVLAWLLICLGVHAVHDHV